MTSRMINRLFQCFLLVVLCRFGWSDTSTPNIVVYLADDLGYGSINAYGAGSDLVRTPNLNKLAEAGVRFTRGFTTGSVCSPTRYGLLTGRYSWRTGLKRGVVNSFDPALIDPDTETIASWLREYGYTSAAIGKWHLGYKSKKFKNLLGELSPGPLDVGFDYHFAVPNNMDDIHKVYIENDHIYGLRSDKISPYGKSFYGRPYAGYDAPQRVTTRVMEDLTDKAIQWIDSLEEERPFFLYFSSVAVHHPISPSERMRGTSNAGAYGDFIHDVDYSVGQLMNALETRGLSENTVFIFTSDNGGDIPKEDHRPEVQAQKAGLALNGDHRGDKHTIFNGGFAVPFIVRYPGNQEGTSSAGLVSTADIFATVSEIVAGEVPAISEAAPDSFSFLPLLKDPSSESNRLHAVLRDVNGRHAVIFEDWKFIDDLLPAGKRINEPNAEMLFHLGSDPEESHNVIESHPEIAERGRKLLNKIRSEKGSRSISLN